VRDELFNGAISLMHHRTSFLSKILVHKCEIACSWSRRLISLPISLTKSPYLQLLSAEEFD